MIRKSGRKSGRIRGIFHAFPFADLLLLKHLYLAVRQMVRTELRIQGHKHMHWISVANNSIWDDHEMKVFWDDMFIDYT